eukprot:jgi/Bigna1/68846/fgenesh1_pg.7_\
MLNERTGRDSNGAWNTLVPRGKRSFFEDALSPDCVVLANSSANELYDNKTSADRQADLQENGSSNDCHILIRCPILLFRPPRESSAAEREPRPQEMTTSATAQYAPTTEYGEHPDLHEPARSSIIRSHGGVLLSSSQLLA